MVRRSRCETHAPDTDARHRGIRAGAVGRKGDIRVHEDAKVCVCVYSREVSLGVGVARRRSRLLMA
jgi:hypothetical protein